MITDNNHDLDWLAFSYAAGELTPAETEQFELRLADDQTAREALARAVELCQVVVAAEIQSDNYIAPAAKTHSTWNHRLSWMAVGGLASLLLALLWSGVVGPTWHTAQLRSFSKQNLAFAWTETKQQIATVREAGYWPSIFIDADDDASPAVAFDDSADEAPSWMTAALLDSSHAESSNADLNTPDTNS
jgi:hypothetical protein